MHIKYIFIISILVLISLPLFSNAQMPFGGLVTAMQPCNSGLLVYVLTPLQGIMPFMWFTGELPFMMYVPPHPGQFLLGQSLPATIPCIIGNVPVGAGFPIIFHGESI